MRQFNLLASLTVGAMLAAPQMARAQEQDGQSVKTTKPSECIAEAKDAAASAEYGGKTYYFTSQACKDEFLTEPERYSQLYDALLELKAQGKTVQKPEPMDNVSAVPS